MQESSNNRSSGAVKSSPVPLNTVYPVLFAISISHLLNDSIQALLPSIYPLLRESYLLTFSQLGLITLTFQLSASLLQPLVGLITDRKPLPFSLPVGMTMTGIGLISLAYASSFILILISAGLIGSGSAIFHPESSRIAHMAAGRRRGLAQSIFQVGGNAGSAIGPLLAALIIVPRGQWALIFFSGVALIGVTILFHVSKWQRNNSNRLFKKTKGNPGLKSPYPKRTIVLALFVLIMLVFSKYIYLSSLTSYYTFYLMDRFDVTSRTAILFLFLLLFSVAVGTMIGGSIGDRYGRKRVIWGSILGVAPFSLTLPHVGLTMTAVLSVFIGLILASAFSAILVYGQELLPGNIGMIAGLFFGLAFGTAGIGSAILGAVADKTGINWVFQLCAYLPLIGLLTIFLPDLKPKSSLAH